MPGTHGLASRLRADTAEAHRSAERSPLMRRILRAEVGPVAYCRLLRSLWDLYDALERGIDRHATDDVVSVVSSAALRRSPALAADLRSLHGPGWATDLVTGQATRRYVERLDRLARVEPALLVAHAYVRYMGDLSGGQLLEPRVAAALGLEGEAGLAFYRFPAIPDPAAFKAGMRAALDALPVDPPRADRIVGEAQWAFAGNLAIFDEVEADTAVRA